MRAVLRLDLGMRDQLATEVRSHFRASLDAPFGGAAARTGRPARLGPLRPVRGGRGRAAGRPPSGARSAGRSRSPGRSRRRGRASPRTRRRARSPRPPRARCTRARTRPARRRAGGGPAEYWIPAVSLLSILAKSGLSARGRRASPGPPERSSRAISAPRLRCAETRLLEHLAVRAALRAARSPGRCGTGRR